MVAPGLRLLLQWSGWGVRPTEYGQSDSVCLLTQGHKDTATFTLLLDCSLGRSRQARSTLGARGAEAAPAAPCGSPSEAFGWGSPSHQLAYDLVTWWETPTQNHPAQPPLDFRTMETVRYMCLFLFKATTFGDNLLCSNCYNLTFRHGVIHPDTSPSAPHLCPQDKTWATWR